jgi:dTDP-4-dehydrorhamnose reductase
LVTGRTGQIARSLSELKSPLFEFVSVGRPTLDLTDRASLEATLANIEPIAVVNAAAYTAVDKAETEEAAAFAVNCEGAGAVAAVAGNRGIPIIHLSTDYVFAGDKAGSYVEADKPDPQSVYGRSKLAGEQAVAAANPAHVILRTAWVYSPFGSNFLKTMLRLAEDRDVVRVVGDQHGTPTYALDIAEGILAVLRQIAEDPAGSEWRGTYHMVAEGEATWAEFAEAIFAEAERAGRSHTGVEVISTDDYPTPAKRPANSRMATEAFRTQFGHQLPAWQTGVERCITAISSGLGAKGQPS